VFCVDEGVLLSAHRRVLCFCAVALAVLLMSFPLDYYLFALLMRANYIMASSSQLSGTSGLVCELYDYFAAPALFMCPSAHHCHA
jgi:hypothetical protein